MRNVLIELQLWNGALAMMKNNPKLQGMSRYFRKIRSAQIQQQH